MIIVKGVINLTFLFCLIAMNELKEGVGPPSDSGDGGVSKTRR